MWKWIATAGLASIGASAFAQDHTECATIPTQAERDACNADLASPAPAATADGDTITVSEADVDTAESGRDAPEEPGKPKPH